MTGQDAANTAKAFGEALPLTGVVLTKTDGDARGGAALSVRYITGKPIKFVGVSEKPDGLDVFHPDRIASRILDMGDVLSLVEQVEQQVDKDKAQKLAEKVAKGKKFDLNDMRDQLEQMQNMGGIGGLMDKLPGLGNIPEHLKQQVSQGKEVPRMIAIINSMTKKERRNPGLLNGSRRARIALLEADVALPVVQALVERIKVRAVGQEVLKSLTPGQALIKVVRDELTAVMGSAASDLNLNVPAPAIILMAGLQGAGKTTTVGKLAKHLKEKRKKKVMVVSADVYRPAAIEQLQTLADQVGVLFFPSSADQKPEAIVRAAIDDARKSFVDVLIVDTAGRLAIDDAMMAEICLLYTSPSPRDRQKSRMPSSA